MLQVALDRLRAELPTARIEVFTEEPKRLLARCPTVVPLPVETRRAAGRGRGVRRLPDRRARALLWASLRCRLVGASDPTRWAMTAEHDPAWEERARLAASLVEPGARVVEFGAGRRALERSLPPGCTDLATDLVPRVLGSTVIDLNAPLLPPLDGYDTAVFCGVLEYLRDLPGVARWLACQGVARVIASYNPALSPPGRPARVVRRALRGWVNAYDERELLAAFAAAGFELELPHTSRAADSEEPMYRWRRPKAPAG
jgi:hypothetical protein